jgi:alpha-L-arabinofuranosidase
MTCYYVPLRTGSHKEYCGQTDSFWCCTGTGVENHAKYGDSIYFHDGSQKLYVNLFIASELNWKAKGLQLRQETRYPDEGQTKLTFTCQNPTELTLNVRRPFWAKQEFEVRINGRKQWVVSQPGEYAVIGRIWNTGDTIEVNMPFTLRTEAFRDNPRRFAVLNGPLVLCAAVDTNQVVPLILGEPTQLLAHLQPVDGRPSTFAVNDDVVRAPGRAGAVALTFEPFYAMHGKRTYEVYFDAVTPEEFHKRETAQAAAEAASKSATLTVRVDQPGPKVSPSLWGIFFEDINLSADGGIYPELVRNRSFEDSDQPEHWTLDKGSGATAEMEIDSHTPLNPVNRHSLRVHLNGPIALVNRGYWGMNIAQKEKYELTFYARATNGFKGPVKASLETANGRTAASGQVTGVTDKWQRFALELTATESDSNASLKLAVDGQGTLWLDMVSLLPQRTWKEHGLRLDLAQMLSDLRPAFMRFPGGCWVEGDDMAHMYHWKETIGDVSHRQPLWNIWAYNATHGLGFHEYLQLAEDLGATPLFCINVGMSHRENVPLDQMGQWVQDALDAIEYANGSTNSVWGAQRAQHGHPAPFNLKYLEIGNENGGPAYQDRYALFHDAIKARHPEIHLVANVPTEQRPADIVDEHYYSSPEFFIGQAHRYDTYPRDGSKIFVGEYAVTAGCGQGNLRAAVGEAAFMTGMERNADVVAMASYAPLFVNVNHKRWNPDLINFDSSRAYGIPSYFVQQMFSENRGDTILPVEVQSPATSEAPKGGAIGVGTWLTEAEFKDIKVIHDGQTVFTTDFASGTEGWHLHGGNWKTEGGVFRQTSREENVRAILGGKSWTDYTYSLKARKLGGAEGFLILFNVQDEDSKAWWNIGGWGNRQHAIELGGIVGKEVPGQIETGRWYDIRIEVNGSHIKCYLDDKLVHDVGSPVTQSLYASATRIGSDGEVILKLVNVSSKELTTQIDLAGLGQIRGLAKLITLTSAKPSDENSLAEPMRVAPVTQQVPIPGPKFERTFPGNSVTVLRIAQER